MNESVLRDSKQTGSAEATPEQLVAMLDRELATKRSHKPWTSRNRATILVVGVLFIVVGAGVALLVLDQMLADLRQNGGAAQTSSAPAHTNF
jgi:hypothetical protein